MTDGQEVVAQPVDHQTGGEVEEHDGEDDRHEHHDLLLRGIASGGGEALLEEHGGAHQQRGDVEGIGRGEVGQPRDVCEGQMRDKGGVAQLDGVEQGLIEPDEDRNLHQYGQAG